MIMNPKRAFSLFASLAVALAVVSAMAQDEPRPKKLLRDNDGRFSDPLSPTRKSADLAPSSSDMRKSADLAPSSSDMRKSADLKPLSDTVDWAITPDKNPDPRIRKIGGVEAELMTQTNVLIRELEAADSVSQRESAKTKLNELLAKQFDLRQERHEREIKALEAQVKKLKELVQKRQENREEIIARRLDQLVRESQGLGF
jgi:hypothetical protein